MALMDARSDSDIEDAIEECIEALPRGHVSLRTAAAKTLGRLHRPHPRAIAGLGAIAIDPSEPAELRTMAAWALGEMRSPESLDPLVDVLRTPLDARTGHFVLEAIAKHYAVMTTDEARLVEIVESMVYFAGNQQEEVSGFYDVLGARLRTVSVNVKVLERAIDSVAEKRTPEQLAEVYTAAFELLARLEATKEEIAAGPAAWKTRVDESVRQSQRVLSIEDERSELLVLWYLGKLARLREIGRPAADALLGEKSRPTISRSPAVRLVAAWMLSRMLLYGTGPKHALERDLLPREVDPAVLDLFGGMSKKSGELDLLQKIRGEP
jgi:HEAT repeat protein